jgi:hypothetical protein
MGSILQSLNNSLRPLSASDDEDEKQETPGTFSDSSYFDCQNYCSFIKLLHIKIKELELRLEDNNSKVAFYRQSALAGKYLAYGDARAQIRVDAVPVRVCVHSTATELLMYVAAQAPSAISSVAVFTDQSNNTTKTNNNTNYSIDDNDYC